MKSVSHTYGASQLGLFKVVHTSSGAPASAWSGTRPPQLSGGPTDDDGGDDRGSPHDRHTWRWDSDGSSLWQNSSNGPLSHNWLNSGHGYLFGLSGSWSSGQGGRFRCINYPRDDRPEDCGPRFFDPDRDFFDLDRFFFEPGGADRRRSPDERGGGGRLGFDPNRDRSNPRDRDRRWNPGGGWPLTDYVFFRIEIRDRLDAYRFAPTTRDIARDVARALAGLRLRFFTYRDPAGTNSPDLRK